MPTIAMRTAYRNRAVERSPRADVAATVSNGGSRSRSERVPPCALPSRAGGSALEILAHPLITAAHQVSDKKRVELAGRCWYQSRMRKPSPCAAVLALVAVAGCSSDCLPVWSHPLSRELLERSLELGTRHLLANQKDAGNFNYSYDWRAKELSQEDNDVRQTGALWGLALIYQYTRSPEVGAAVDRALAFFEEHSRSGTGGTRFVVYPGSTTGHSGAPALVALALIDYLRAEPDHLSAARRGELRVRLDEYLAELLRLRRSDGLWHAYYDVGTGAPVGDNNPYVDGEALLALAKAARYMGRDDLRAAIMESAEKGYQENIVAARAKNRDSDTTKGYYQWSSMAFFELATSGWPDTTKFSGRVIELADWMIDVHHTLGRSRNTAYAYEGIIHAYRLAVLADDREHAAKFAQVIKKGMAKLTSWQVGHPGANSCIVRTRTDDPLALGGVQNHHAESALRIDVTQHQMHAVILALKYFYGDSPGI